MQPMLAVAGSLPEGPGWAYEFKWDGMRALASTNGQLKLHSRTGTDVTAAFPELRDLPEVAGDAVLDGEIVALGTDGRPSWPALAERMHVQSPVKAARLARTNPVTYVAFDILQCRGHDLTGFAYERRRELLERLPLNGNPRWIVSPKFDDGPATRAAAWAMDLEGVMAKRLDSPYRPGARDVSWVKVKSERTADLVVGGWRPGAGTLGALLVGTMRLDGWLDYRGRVGVGISSADEMELLTALAADGIRRRSPFVGNVTVRTARFVLPKIVVEVRYGELLPDGKLRFARLARVRWDKTPVDTIGQL